MTALLAWLAFVLLPAPAFAQTAAGAAPAQAAVLTPGSMVTLAGMDFGTIMRPNAAGTVVLSPTGLGPPCLPTGGLVLWGNGCHPAHFSILGRKHWKARIRELNGGTVVLTGPGGATMTVTNFTLRVGDMTSSPGGGGGPGTFGRYDIDTDPGFAEFWIGGRLNVAANQAAGQYQGQFIVQVQFN